MLGLFLFDLIMLLKCGPFFASAMGPLVSLPIP
jgi:hypothetical protein